MSTQTATSTRQCASCSFWQSQSGDNGECRRRAPQPIAFKVDEDVRYEARFPTTTAADWCGEYSPKG